MNATQAAEKLGLSVSTIRRWCRTGRIQAVKAGRAWVIEPASLPVQTEGTSMIEKIQIKDARRNWRGDEITTVVTMWSIEGTVTEIIQGEYSHHAPKMVVQAGDQTVTVACDLGGAVYKPKMIPVQVGDRVRITAAEELLDGGEYDSREWERL